MPSNYSWEQQLVPNFLSFTYFDFAQKNGIEFSKLLLKAKLPSGTRPNLTLTHKQFEQLIEAVLGFCDKSIGVEIGKMIPPIAFGALGNALITSPTLKIALQTLTRFWELIGLGIGLFVEQNNEYFSLSFFALPNVKEPIRQTVLESVLTIAINNCITLCPSLRTEIQCEFDFSKPNDDLVFYDICQNVKFSQSQACIKIPNQFLLTPSIMANDLIFTQSIEECERQYQRLSHMPSIVSLVYGFLLIELKNQNHQLLTLDKVAQQLHICNRTLRRKLEREQTNFLGLLNLAKYKTAINLLGEKNLAIQEISNMLGYENPANFNRAFKRWHGCSPSQFRISNAK